MALKKCKECGQQVSSKAKSCPHCGASIPQNVGIGTIAILLFVIYAVYIVSSEKKPQQEKVKSPKEIALEQVKLVNFGWYKVAFGSVMEANFSISNESNYDIKDIEITCNHFAKSGTKIDSNNRTIYEVIKTKQKKKLRNFNMGFIHDQANTSACKITNLELQL